MFSVIDCVPFSLAKSPPDTPVISNMIVSVSSSLQSDSDESVVVPCSVPADIVILLLAKS